MRFEHIALQVRDPVAVAAWYTTHLGLRVLRYLPQRNHTHFLGDDAGMALEIYHAPDLPVPDFWAQDPLLLHLALVSADPQAEAQRLVAGGAQVVDTVRAPDGSVLVMLRDPWGLPLQLCRRTVPLE